MPTKQITRVGYDSWTTVTNESATVGECCPECGQMDLDVDGNEQFCPACGLVVTTNAIELSIPEWTDRQQRHVGPTQSNQWLQRGTCIGDGSDTNTARAARLRRYNTRLSASERTLHRGLRELRGICEELNVGDASRERAAYLYESAVEKDLLQGRSLEAFAAAAVFVALRERSYPITLDWLAESAFATPNELGNAYRRLLSSLDLRVLPPLPRDFLPKVASKLGVTPRLERTARCILERATEAGVSQGKHPAGFAGAALYAATQTDGQSLKQEEVANASGVSLVTISRRWRTLDDELNLTEVVQT